MKSVIIYDASGAIHNVLYGETERPEGVLSIVVDIPNGCTPESVDVSKTPPMPVFNYWPAIDLDVVKTEVKNIRNVLPEFQKTADTQEQIAGLYEYLIQLDFDVAMLQLGF